jgi:catechol 2,3-dioxygenase-like lactoylglutathione lyase family enzyme
VKTTRTGLGIEVRDLQRSVRFYGDGIGLQVDIDAGVPDIAILTTSHGQQVSLAGKAAPRWEEILAPGYTVLRPGEKIFMIDSEFEVRLARLAKRRIEHRLIERPWGDRVIEVTCPDGYGVSILEPRQRSRTEILRMVNLARGGFRKATVELADRELFWRPGPGEWSIREIIHHVADSSLTVLHATRVAIAEPGKIYYNNPYDQRLYSSELRYQERNHEPSLHMIESVHDVLLSTVEAVPDPWNRALQTSTGRETSVETYLLMLAVHNLEHLEQINDIREQCGYSRLALTIE